MPQYWLKKVNQVDLARNFCSRIHRSQRRQLIVLTQNVVLMRNLVIYGKVKWLFVYGMATSYNLTAELIAELSSTRNQRIDESDSDGGKERSRSSSVHFTLSGISAWGSGHP